MTWTRYDAGYPDPGGAVELVDTGDGHLGWLTGTSKGTVNLYEYDGVERLRMFGVTSGEVVGVVGEGEWLNITSPLPAGTSLEDGDPLEEVVSIGGVDMIQYTDTTLGYYFPSEPIYYIESEPAEPYRFRIKNGTATDDAPLRPTVIPAQKHDRDWAFTLVSYGDTIPGDYGWAEIEDIGEKFGVGVLNIRNLHRTFDVQYKDPCVVHLPKDQSGNGRGWVMLLSRVRSDAGKQDSSPNNSMSDIVAYWADENCPGFDKNYNSEDGTGVKGPYWIAINISTLPGTAGIRFWLSVPGGAVIDIQGKYYLAVYFVVEAANEYGVVETPTEGITTSSTDAIFAGLYYLDRTTTTKFQSCIGVHLIDIDEFKFDDPSATNYGNESEWAQTSYSLGGPYALPRTRGKLYLWYDTDGAGSYKPLAEVLESDPCAFDARYLKLADPQCGRTSLETADIGTLDYLRLFNSTIGRSETNETDWGYYFFETTGHPMMLGLWMATAIDPTEVIGLTRVVSSDGIVDATPLTMPGFDFLLTSSQPFEPGYIYAVAEHWFWTGYPDPPGPPDDPRWIETWSPYAWLALDPDPVRLSLSDGTWIWRVYFGVQDDKSDMPDPGVVSEPTPTGTRTLFEEDDDGSDV